MEKSGQLGGRKACLSSAQQLRSQKDETVNVPLKLAGQGENLLKTWQAINSNYDFMIAATFLSVV